jgi:cell division protein ZapA (FtsZ GTPase activity inhibitor)
MINEQLIKVICNGDSPMKLRDAAQMLLQTLVNL